MKLAFNNLRIQRSAGQSCNYYIKRLRRLRNGEKVLLSEGYLKNLIRIYYYESKLDLLYLPNETIKVSSIADILHYETEFGKNIYEKEKK